MRIAVCHAQVPMARGGAEALVDTLCAALRRHGHEAAVVQLPYAYGSRRGLLQTGIAWRLLDVTPASAVPVDLVIATKFPSYLVRHPNKSVWLTHQYRQAYDLAGTPFSDFQGRGGDRAWQWLIRQSDNRSLAEARRVFTISRNVADRLRRFNGISAPTLYPPPPLLGRYRHRECGDRIVGIGRLEPLKRFDLLVEAMARTSRSARCVIVGTGPQHGQLSARIEELGIGDRVRLVEHVTEDELLDLYAEARAVYYGPIDEDYGYVTVEAMASGTPVITLEDAGGPLEFVEPGITGWVAAPHPDAIAAAIAEAAADALRCRDLGSNGRERVSPITWDPVIEALVVP